MTIRAKLQSRDGVFAMLQRWVGEYMAHALSTSKRIGTWSLLQSTSADLACSHTSISIFHFKGALKSSEVILPYTRIVILTYIFDTL